MTSENLVYEVEPGLFQEQVVDASAERTVVVDFWAEWCAPCRSLGPVLEEVVRSYGGRVALAKLDVDENPQVAARYGIRGIPAVKIFRDGRVVKEFVGALPRARVEALLSDVIPNEADDLVAAGDALLEEGESEEAESRYREALHRQPGHPAALLRLGKLALETGREEARELLDQIEQDAPEYEQARALLAQVEFIGTCRENGGTESARRRVQKNPDDLDARYGLACCLAAEGDYEDALEEFLEVLRRDRNYHDQAPRLAMLRMFALLGPQSETAKTYRKKLAGVLY